ncbi:potassium channel subfamily T member 2 isoform X3 [Spodoptera frugiperda]|uniref:Potassium channel subfamily T member 2 isoform X3 n=1 Tax=Spodoptera frugiperda TaxID=7108 RepID=A0A9R0CUC0_SPOFR|nr:potassium channel subfamily T member 2 isoform X3 [Spodoptera frugiperda]
MSIFFFRFHNLQRAEENRKKHYRNTKTRRNMNSDVLTAPSRLLERPLSEPVDSLDEIALQIPRVRVEYYVNENTFKERLQLYFIKNQRSSLRIRIANLFFKLLTCVLYICRVCADGDPITASCYGCRPGNKTEFEYSANLTEEEFQEHPIINWDGIIWVNRPLYLWVVQVILAMISFTEAILLAYLGYKGNIWQQVLSFHFILEMVNTIPFALTLPFPPLRNLFIPVFLNCWLAKRSLENMFNDLHRAMQKSQSALSQQLMILCVTLLCLVFTSVCGIQHFQRAGHRHLNLFQATYFVVVTFSTVGYGDFVPDIWPSQLFMVIMIGVALVVLPTQFEQLAFTWMERQKLGGSYSSHRAQSEKHVVVCSTTLHADTIMDFLNEFYAHPLLQDYYVVLLSPMELDTTMRMILQVPIWAQRVIYIQGSCLKDTDLIRARMNEAEACFILAARNYADKTAADEHTILRSWAVKDFAPAVPQYVQIFRPENKLHVKFAEFVVCEDEFKYALLANNCTCPGASTLVTLLLHTSRGQEGQQSPEEWHRLYGKCSGNEIYHIVLGDSRFFGEYEGKSFTYASFHSHRKYGVALVGVRPAELPEFYEETILLNPGPRHIMKNSDTCYYMSITKEENSAFVVADKQSEQKPTIPKDQTACSLLSNEKKPGDAEEVSDQQKKPDGSSVAQYDLPQVILQAPASSTPKASPSRINQANTVSSANFTVTGSKYGEGTSAGDSRTCSKDSPGTDSATDSHLLLPKPDNNFLSPDALNYRRGSRRPSILPVPDMVTSNLNIASDNQDEEVEADESEDELEDDVPWRSPSEKIADDVTTSSFSSLAASDIAHSAWRNDYMRIVKGFPPVSPFIGVSPTLCYLLKEKKSLCCLQLAQVCEHCAYRNAKEYQWQNKTIILAADYASNGIYNFIIPLRAHFRSKTSLNPIILLLERRPDIAFLDAISYFPLVYWMLGSIDCLDDLLRAGITLAENVVVVNKELSNSAEEDSLADCNTIVAVQTMFKFFPSIKSITELSQSSNMRFMQFRAHDKYALHLSKMEKREKERGSHISYMFRLPFAAGSVFSASMLDTLLYQAFVKDYVITFVRLLLGVDQAPGSGFLTSMKISKEDMWIRTYGRLYQKLCSTTCEIPIGIYRTQDTTLADASHHVSMSPRTPSKWFWSRLARMRPSRASLQQEEGEGGGFSTCGRREAASCLSGCYGERTPAYSTSLADEARDNHAQQIERAEIANLVRSRMESLNLTGIDYDDVSEKRNSLSYVIINPSCDLNLQEGDIIYLVRPSPFSAQKTFERHNSRRKSNISFCSQALIQAQGVSSRRGSTIGASFVPPRAPPLSTTKANSLSLPDSPTIITDFRGRSNSLRVVDDILLRRSNSLRQGLSGVGSRRRKSSLEEIGISHFNSLLQHQQQQQQQNAFKIALNGSIGLEVTPPEEHPLERLPGPSIPLGGYQEVAAALPSSSLGPSLPSVTPTPDPQHLQGTIV